MDADTALREQLARLLERSEAHLGFDEAVADVPAAGRGIRPAGFAHSAWELLEHIRLAQRDILEFCLPGEYALRDWPADYWHATPEPPSAEAWDASVEAIRHDREEFQRLVADPATDLLAVVPHGTTQTYLREVLLTADHNAYHLGQLTVVRRLL
jgi:uncharacterized damage-inducible protein DinB